MKKLTSLILLAIFAGGLTMAGPALSALQTSKEFTRTEVLAPGGRLVLDTYKGSVLTTSWERNEVQIVAVIEAPDDVDPEYGRKTVEATRIEVTRGSNSVRIKSDYSDVPTRRSSLFSWNTSLPEIHYQIKAPRQLDLKIEDHKSTIEVYGFEGDIDIESHKGHIEARDLRGRVRVDTHKGIAELSELQGGIELSTHKGRMTAQVDGLDRDSRLETHKGTISILLPESQAALIRADLSKRAHLRSNFGLDKKHRSDDRFEAPINGGNGPRLTVVSHKGDIRIDRR